MLFGYIIFLGRWQVIREHGLMDGLFKPEEMNSGNFKDKESKVGYIQKVIDTLGGRQLS